MKRTILIALSLIFLVGMALSYFLGAPWVVPLLFFSLALASLFPLGQAVDLQRERVLPRAISPPN